MTTFPENLTMTPQEFQEFLWANDLTIKDVAQFLKLTERQVNRFYYGESKMHPRYVYRLTKVWHLD